MVRIDDNFGMKLRVEKNAGKGWTRAGTLFHNFRAESVMIRILKGMLEVLERILMSWGDVIMVNSSSTVMGDVCDHLL